MAAICIPEWGSFMRARFFLTILVVMLLTVPAFAFAVSIATSKWDWFEAASRVKVQGRLANAERGYKNSRLVTMEVYILGGGRRQLVDTFKVTVLPDSDAEFEHDTYGVSKQPDNVYVQIAGVE